MAHARRAGGGATRDGAAAAALGRLVGMEHIRTTKVGARRPLAAEGPAGRAAWAGFPSGVGRRGPAVSLEGPAAFSPRHPHHLLHLTFPGVAVSGAASGLGVCRVQSAAQTRSGEGECDPTS